MTAALHKARRLAGAVRRRMFPTPALAAWYHATNLAQTTPRFTHGRIRMMDLDLRYSDLASFCPQWHDIFVCGALEFRPTSHVPRILDCGANVGLASLFFKRRFPHARVTAYEADPALVELLRANLAGNGAADVEIIHAALWTSTGEITFRCEGSDSGMIESLPGAVPGMSRSVPSLRLRDVLRSERIDLLKLDIEGAEDAVLEDCEPALDRVRAIVMDLHEFDPAIRQAPRVLERLTRLGFAYSVDEFIAQPWRPPVADPDSPFPGKALIWSMTVRAWRPGA